MNSNGVIVIIIGLLIIYLGITGRYKCFSAFASCVSGNDTNNASASNTGTIAPLPPLTPQSPVINNAVPRY